jgi:hypothetical protein
MVAETMRKVLALLRAAGIAGVYAITLGCLFAAKQFWIDQAPNPGTGTSRLRMTAEAVLRTSPYIILTGMLFAILVIPLATWSVGSASWRSLRKYVYAFWSVLALFIVASGNPDGLILISGSGLIVLWFLRNRRSLSPARSRSKDGVRIQLLLRTADFTRKITVFTILIVIDCALSLFLFLGNGTKVYVSEIFAIYTVASICQGFRAFVVIVHGQNASPENTP